MTDFVTPSPEELAQRRRVLKQQRRWRNLQNIWRVLAISGLAAGTVWLIYHPFWLVLHSSNQVLIEGNEMLSDEAIRQLLALEYPQPLLKIEPEVMVQRLQTQSPIALAQVDRQLFPPRLTITLQEREPVASTVPSSPSDTGEATPTTHAGLVDAQGHWMAQDATAMLKPGFELPTLRVRGFKRQYQPQWPTLYSAVQQSTVNITEIDWRSSTNLILQTELGAVHLGVYEPQRLQQQLSTLPRLRALTTTPNTPAVEYIDLTNPQMPAVKLIQSPPQAAEAP